MKKLSERRYMQIIIAFIAALSAPAILTHLSWVSPALPILQSPDSPLGRPITDEEGSWIASILYLLVLPGGFVGGFLAEKFGRKMCLLLGGILSLLAWIIILLVKNITAVYIARALAGVALGVISTISSIYMGEIADDDIRGTIGMGAYLLNPVTSMIMLSAGPYMSYSALATLCIIIAGIFVISFVWMPETPHYFIKKGDYTAAKNSLIKLSASSTTEDCLDEKIMKMQKLMGDIQSKNKISLREFISSWRHLKPFFIMAGIQVISLLSGSTAIEAYTQTIITATESSLSPEVSSIIIGCVKIPSVIIALILCDKLGRRPLFVISGLGCAIALLGEGLYFYIYEFHEDYVSNISWLPTTALSAFMIMHPLGIGSVPYVLASEMLSPEVKEISAAFLQFFMGAASFAVAKTFAPISNALGAYTMFWFYGGVCLFSGAYIYAFVPETKGKSLGEIQKELYGKENISLDEKSKNVV